MYKRSQISVSIAIVILSCPARPTRSEDVTEASSGTRSLAPLPFQLVLPREHLLGDWYGTRTWLEDRGIVPTLTFVSDSLGNPSGGREQGFTTANNVGLDLNFDLEKLCGFEGGSFLFSMSYRFGGSLRRTTSTTSLRFSRFSAAKRSGWSTSPTSRNYLMIASNSDSAASRPATIFSSRPTTTASYKTASMAIRSGFSSTPLV